VPFDLDPLTAMQSSRILCRTLKAHFCAPPAIDYGAPEGTRADGINVTIPSLGVLTGAGNISPSGALNFEMNANLGGGSGRGISFGIEGITSAPKFVPEAKSFAGKAVARKVTGNEQKSDRAGRLGRRRD